MCMQMLWYSFGKHLQVSEMMALDNVYVCVINYADASQHLLAEGCNSVSDGSKVWFG